MIFNPLVSIVIPIYNQKESFLRECIESAISQTYSNTEIIVSDNHSTNNVPNILKEYQNLDSRIKVVRPERFLNMSESFLYVFAQAKGKYSCYISSDDVLNPNCISELIYKMEGNENIAFSHGMARYFEPYKSDYISWKYFNEISGVFSFNKEIISRLLNLSYVCFGGCLIRNSVWTQIDQTIREKNIILNNYLDIVCTIILFLKGDLYFLNKVLVSVRVENDSRNNKQSVLVKDALDILNLFQYDNFLFNKIKEFEVDFISYKEKHYKQFLRATLFEFLNKVISYNDFLTTNQSLRIYNISTNKLMNLLVNFCINFPELSIHLFQLLKRVKNFKKLY